MDDEALDRLTGLPVAFPVIRANAEYGAAVYADIDELKPLNECYGVTLGDAVIAAVANAIDHASPYPTYRFGGDEFLVTIPPADADQATSVTTRVEAAVTAADRLLDHVSARVRSDAWPNYLLTGQARMVDAAIEHVTISVGVATAAETGDSRLETLAGQAMQAMYRARHEHRHGPNPPKQPPEALWPLEVWGDRRRWQYAATIEEARELLSEFTRWELKQHRPPVDFQVRRRGARQATGGADPKER